MAFGTNLPSGQPPEWLAEYIGIPYVTKGRDGRGLDCWGLIVVIYKERFGLHLNEYGDVWWDSTEANRGIAACVDDYYPQWRPVERSDVRFGDLVLFNVAGIPVHIGMVVTDKLFIHTYHGSANSCIGRFNDIKWSRRIEGYYRYAPASDR